MKNFITNKIYNYGMGARMNFLIGTISLTEILKDDGNDVEFIFTPFSYEGFGMNFHSNQIYSISPNLSEIKNPKEEYLKYCYRWDEMISFKGPKVTEVESENIEINGYPYSETINEKLVYENSHKIKDKIKYDLFSLPKKIKKPYIDVCIHIRRNDVTSISYPDRFLDDSYYIEIIDIIKNTLGDKCKITIHTQKNNFDSEKYHDCEIIYDGDILETECWLSLVNSDVLVISKSAFSYSSGLLCDGLVVCPDDMFHPKLNHWTNKNELEKSLKNISYE